MGNLNESSKNDNENPFRNLRSLSISNKMDPADKGRPPSKNPERVKKEGTTQALLGSMTSNRFFQSIFQNNKPQQSNFSSQEIKEAIDFSNFLLDFYALQNTNTPANFSSLLLNEEKSQGKGQVARGQTRMSMFEKQLPKKVHGEKSLKELMNEIRSAELFYSVEMLKKKQVKGARIKNKKQIGGKKIHSKKTEVEENELIGIDISDKNEMPNRRNSLQVVRTHDKKTSNTSVNKINANMLNLLQQKKILAKAKNSDSGNSIFAKFMKTKNENREKAEQSSQFNEKTKSNIMNDLKALGSFKKRTEPIGVSRCDDLSSKHLSDTSAHSTARKTAEFIVVPDSTFSFQNVEWANHLGSECSIKLGDKINLEEAISRASIQNKSKRDSYFKENSRLSVIEENSFVENSMLGNYNPKYEGGFLQNSIFGKPGKKKSLKNLTSESSENSELKDCKMPKDNKKKSFLEKINEVAENSRLKEKSMNESKSVNRSKSEKRRDEDGQLTKSSRKQISQDKIREIARSNSSKVNYTQGFKSEKPVQQKDNSMFLANITQKYSFFKPKSDVLDGLMKARNDSKRNLNEFSVHPYQTPMRSFSRTQFEYNGNHLSTSGMLKTKVSEKSFFESEKYNEMNCESTNHSSKEANLRKDNNITLNIRNLPKNIKFNMESCFKK